MSFLIKVDKLFVKLNNEIKYNEIFEKVKDTLKKEFDNEPAYDKKYLKGKTKSYNVKINTNFYNNKIS